MDLQTSTRADIVVVSMDDEVLLMVSGRHTPQNQELVSEVRAALVVGGIPDDRVAVLWS